MRFTPLILAAGKGTRMSSNKPKVLQTIGGKPMLQHVLDNCHQAGEADPAVVVVGFEAEQIKDFFESQTVYSLQYVEQRQQLGTGHAVQVATDDFADDATVLILYGDVPLVTAKTLRAVVAATKGGKLSLLTVNLDNPYGYGRIVRDQSQQVMGIVEQKDASPEQLAIIEVNTGILALNGGKLKQLVSNLSNGNAQGEYLLTDIISKAVMMGMIIETCQPQSANEVLGANDRKQLAQMEKTYQTEQAEKLLTAGASLADPERLRICGSVQVGKDVHIAENVSLFGDVIIGDATIIESNTVIINSIIAANVHIKSFSHIEQATIANRAIIGPYARLRQGSLIGEGAKVGNFVETKNIDLGAGSKANHLTYLGDSEIGKGVNIGAGTITCNYDGKNKHKTKLSDNAFIGSNSSLVAPVSIGKGATVGAGSVITSDVEDQTLVYTRPKRTTIAGYKRTDQK